MRAFDKEVNALKQQLARQKEIVKELRTEITTQIRTRNISDRLHSITVDQRDTANEQLAKATDYIQATKPCNYCDAYDDTCQWLGTGRCNRMKKWRAVLGVDK